MTIALVLQYSNKGANVNGDCGGALQATWPNFRDRGVG